MVRSTRRCRMTAPRPRGLQDRLILPDLKGRKDGKEPSGRKACPAPVQKALRDQVGPQGPQGEPGTQGPMVPAGERGEALPDCAGDDTEGCREAGISAGRLAPAGISELWR
jgi:hypothetical protein